MEILRDNNKIILTDSNGKILITGTIEDINANLSLSDVIDALHDPYMCPKYRLSILNPDESVAYVIPNDDIIEGGLSYSETYQQGQRRNLTVKLVNKDKKYSPIVNKGPNYMWKNQQNVKIEINDQYGIQIWKNTMFKYDFGLKIKNTTIWFNKGVYIVGKIDNNHEDSSKEITLQLKDKFARFEDNTGKLLNAYEIPEGTLVRKALQDLLNIDFGTGMSFDPKPFLLDNSFYNFKLQATIKKEAGDTIGSILLDMATQMSAECFYNEVGNLMFIPLNDTLNDNGKSVCWQFSKQYKEIISISSTYEFENAINMIKVIGDNVDYGIHSALVVNNDPRSPLCIGNIGKCPDDILSDPNIWSNETAKDLGRYNLRKKSLIPLNLSVSTKMNPLLSVDFLCEIENDYFDFKREKCVINSLSYNDNTGIMSLEMTNIQDLQFVNAGDGDYE